jgi:hypothetical protein
MNPAYRIYFAFVASHTCTADKFVGSRLSSVDGFSERTRVRRNRR